MTKKGCTEEFESEWVKLVHACRSERNEYVMTLYRTRGRWAEIYYFLGYFDNAISQLRHSNAEAGAKTETTLLETNRRTSNKNLGYSLGLDYADVAAPEEGPDDWEPCNLEICL
ncbi:hypothetical protein M9H77_08826 [Catharanthus roseus]|uniref:Uncharacterized protein n=1 Tax=Catharanthus roseus TaxID=4058 RepID=A0ACC0BZ95_CATRO|nr:hypothetical protein M9H77_08826 [Catharanthus roseus]